MNQSLRNTIAAMAAHTSAVAYHRGTRLAALKGFYDSLLAMTPEDEKASCEDYQAAWDARKSGNEKKMIALMELRKTAINNFIRSKSNFAETFFDTVNLENGQSAEYVNSTSQEVAIGYMAQDRGNRLQRAIAPLSNFLVPLKFVKSQKFGYQIEDIQRGNISEAAKSTVDIAFDLAQGMDMNALNLMRAPLASGGVFGNFVTTGPEHLRTYKAHSSIITANLPTTNDLSAPGNSGSTLFRLASVRQVIRYCDMWADVLAGAPLRPTGLLYVPSIDAGDLLDELQATAAKASQIAEGLLSDYTRFELGGKTWTVVPQPTLATGTFYAPLTKPVGTQFLKSSMDKETVETDEEANWEQRYNRKVQGLYTPVQQRVNACRVKYHT